MSLPRSLIFHLLLFFLLGGVSYARAWSFWSSEPEVEAAAGTTSCDPQSCLAVDIAQLQDYVAGLNLSALTWNETEPIESQPFGTLASDWSRLLLLQERQSSGTALRENLLRLSRIILAAYFAQEDDTWTTDDYASTNEYDVAATITTPTPPIKVEIEDERPASQLQPRSSENFESTTTTTSYIDRTDETTGSLFTDNGGAATIVSGNNLTESEESSKSNEAVHEKSKEEMRREEEDAKKFFLSSEEEGYVVDLLEKEKRASIEAGEKIETTTIVEETTAIDDFFAGNETEKNSTSSEEFAGLLTNSVEDFFAQESNETENSTVLSNSVEDFFNQENNETVNYEETTVLSKSIEEFFAHSEEATTVSKSVEDFFAQESEEGGKLFKETGTLTKSVEDFFANERNATSSEEKTSLIRSVENLTQNNETVVEVTASSQSVEDFFANESNSTEKNETSSEEFSGMITKSVEEFFANDKNSTSLEENTRSAENPMVAQNNETTVTSNDSMVEDFFAKEGDETEKSPEEKTSLIRSVENPSVAQSNETRQNSKDIAVEDLFANEGDQAEKNPTSSEEFSGASVKSVDEFFAQDSNETIENSTITNETTNLTTENSFPKGNNETEKNSTTTLETTTLEIEPTEDLASDRIHPNGAAVVRNSEESKNEAAGASTILDDTSQTTTLIELLTETFLTTENSNVMEDPSTTESFEDSTTHLEETKELATEKTTTSDRTTRMEETTELDNEKTTGDDLLEGATTSSEWKLGVTVQEALPTPLPSIMRKVLTTFYRNVTGPNELRESKERVETREEVPLDAHLESSENLQDQAALNRATSGKMIGTRVYPQRTRKRTGAILEEAADVSRQYQTFSGEQTPEKRPEEEHRSS